MRAHVQERGVCRSSVNGGLSGRSQVPRLEPDLVALHLFSVQTGLLAPLSKRLNFSCSARVAKPGSCAVSQRLARTLRMVTSILKVRLLLGHCTRRSLKPSLSDSSGRSFNHSGSNRPKSTMAPALCSPVLKFQVSFKCGRLWPGPASQSECLAAFVCVCVSVLPGIRLVAVVAGCGIAACLAGVLVLVFYRRSRVSRQCCPETSRSPSPALTRGLSVVRGMLSDTIAALMRSRPLHAPSSSRDRHIGRCISEGVRLLHEPAFLPAAGCAW